MRASDVTRAKTAETNEVTLKSNVGNQPEVSLPTIAEKNKHA